MTSVEVESRQNGEAIGHVNGGSRKADDDCHSEKQEAYDATTPPPAAAAAAVAGKKPAASKPSLMQILWAPGMSTSIPADLSIAALRIALTAFCLGLLAGVALPRAWQTLNGWRVEQAVATEDTSRWKYALTRPQLHLYLVAWSTFHLLEFIITARYNPTRLFSDSFLISNGLTYHLAHVFGLLEFVMTTTFLNSTKRVQWTTFLGFCLMLIGQTSRSFAMVHAAGNFSHEVAIRKRQDHVLVTDGIYSLFRHPSYTGFFYWALGTQIMLGNPLSVLIFSVVLWRFFRHRIQNEEIYLVHFFGQPYRDFRARTRTWIPFIP